MLSHGTRAVGSRKLAHLMLLLLLHSCCSSWGLELLLLPIRQRYELGLLLLLRLSLQLGLLLTLRLMLLCLLVCLMVRILVVTLGDMG